MQLVSAIDISRFVESLVEQMIVLTYNLSILFVYNQTSKTMFLAVHNPIILHLLAVQMQ